MTHPGQQWNFLRGLFRQLGEASPVMWRTSAAFLVLGVVCIGLTLVDERTFNGISVWIKPAKFLFSIALHLATLTAALLLLPEQRRNGRGLRALAWLMTATMIFEVVYITFRAARAEPSHYNDTFPGMIFYALMGAGAVGMMLFTAWVGRLLLREGPPSLLARAAGWSFIIAAPLTIFTAMTLSSMASHWIGGDQTDATGLPLLGWSTTGGDLRASHFFALHIMQIVPAAALSGSKPLTWLAGIAMVTAALGSYFLALAGIPLIRIG